MSDRSQGWTKKHVFASEPSTQEIKAIVDELRSQVNRLSGRDDNLTCILNFLQKHSGEPKRRIQSILALCMGMDIKYTKTQYIDGLLDLGIINEDSKGNWVWIGIKALDPNYQPEPEQSLTEYAKTHPQQPEKN